MTMPNDSGAPVREDASRATDKLESRVQQWGANLAEALGRRYPTMEEVVGASIAAIHEARRLSAQAGEIAGLREALEDIANPIGYLRRLCEIEGKQIDGAGAVQFAASVSALQEIARKALAGSPRPHD